MRAFFLALALLVAAPVHASTVYHYEFKAIKTAVTVWDVEVYDADGHSERLWDVTITDDDGPITFPTSSKYAALEFGQAYRGSITYDADTVTCQIAGIACHVGGEVFTASPEFLYQQTEFPNILIFSPTLMSVYFDSPVGEDYFPDGKYLTGLGIETVFTIVTVPAPLSGVLLASALVLGAFRFRRR